MPDLTLREAAEKLGCSVQRVRNLARRHGWPTHLVGGKLVVPDGLVEQFARQQQAHAGDEAGGTLSTTEVAKRLATTTERVRQIVTSGRLRAVKVGGLFRVEAADLERLLRAHPGASVAELFRS
jgi:excisionase family DNA binding protein